MSNVTFTIGSNRNCQFTSSQMEKVQAGIQVFEKVMNSSNFKNAVCNFTWTSENGTTYNRFHMSNGMSNEQVWNCLWNCCSNMMNEKNTSNNVVVMPCSTSNDFNWCMNSGMPMVCINVNYLNQEWYTPVHVASCILNEMCTCCCGFTTNTSMTSVSDWKNTVPYSCSMMMKTCAVEVCSDMPNMNTWMQWVNTTNFNCYPCSATWANENVMNVNTMNSCLKMNETICAMECEVEWLNAVENKSADEVSRMTMLNNCINTMREMCTNMQATSLDGCETNWMPVVNSNSVVA